MTRSTPPSAYPDRSRAQDLPADGEQAASLGAQDARTWAWHPRAWSDVLLTTGLVVLAAVAALTLPFSSTVRAALTLPVLLVAPGYLLLQCLLVPARGPPRRLLHAVLGLGISPPLVGLMALSTTVVPGTFTPDAIIGAVTLGCLALGAVAVVRRERHRAAGGQQAAADDPAAE